MRFGISTHLYHDTPPRARASGRDQGVRVRRHRAVRDAQPLRLSRRRPRSRRLAEWLDELGLTLHSVHAPINESLIDGQWGAAFSNATADEPERRQAVAGGEAGARASRSRIPFEVLVVHAGTPDGYAPPGDNQPRRRWSQRRGNRRAAAAEVGVRTAVEVIPNALSDTAALVQLLEDELDLPGAGHLPRLRARAPARRSGRRGRDRVGAAHLDARARQRRQGRPPSRAVRRRHRLGRRADGDAEDRLRPGLDLRGREPEHARAGAGEDAPRARALRVALARRRRRSRSERC